MPRDTCRIWQSLGCSCNMQLLMLPFPACASESAAPAGRVASVLVELEHLVAEALQTAFPGQHEKPLVAATRDSKKFGGDYQCNNAMALFAKLKGKVSVLT